MSAAARQAMDGRLSKFLNRFGWFVLWFAWGTLGGMVVIAADGAMLLGIGWWMLGIAIGLWGGTALDYAFKRFVFSWRTEEWHFPTAGPNDIHPRIFLLEHSLDLMRTSPERSWRGFLILIVGVGLIHGPLLGPLVGLLAVGCDSDLDLSVSQGAMLGALFGPPTMALLVGVTIGSCILLERRPSLDAIRPLVRRAAEEATLMGHEHIGAEHLFAAVSNLENSPTASALAHAGVSQAELRAALIERLNQRVAAQTNPFLLEEESLSLSLALFDAYETARKQKHKAVSPEHLQLALLQLKECVVPEVVKAVGIDSPRLQKEVRDKLNQMPR